MPSTPSYLPKGYNDGRDIDISASMMGNAGYYFSESVRNFSIQQAGNVFSFRRWLSSQSNFNIFPYATDATESGALFTRISNPSFVLDAGEYLDQGLLKREFLFTWIYLKSDATTANHERLYYKSNATGMGVINKAALDPNYYFVKPDIEQAVEVGDYLYMSFTSDNTNITFNKSLVCDWSTWYGAFFRVTDISVAGQITMVEDNTIFATLYPSSNINHFVKSLPVANALVTANAMIYDFGYCFQRPASTDYLRPIAITIDETFFPNSNESNGIISTHDNFNNAFVWDTFTALNISDFVVSLNLPICRTVQFSISFNLDQPDDPYLHATSLGGMNVNVAPISMDIETYLYYSNNRVFHIPNINTRGYPIILYHFTGGAQGGVATDVWTNAVSADYQLGRV